MLYNEKQHNGDQSGEFLGYKSLVLHSFINFVPDKLQYVRFHLQKSKAADTEVVNENKQCYDTKLWVQPSTYSHGIKQKYVHYKLKLYSSILFYAKSILTKNRY